MYTNKSKKLIKNSITGSLYLLHIKKLIKIKLTAIQTITSSYITRLIIGKFLRKLTWQMNSYISVLKAIFPFPFMQNARWDHDLLGIIFSPLVQIWYDFWLKQSDLSSKCYYGITLPIIHHKTIAGIWAKKNFVSEIWIPFHRICGFAWCD